MLCQARTLRSAVISVFSLALFLVSSLHTAQAAPLRPLLQVTSYVIDADLDPATHKLSATAKLSVTALDNVSTAIFELHNGLQITKITDGAGKPVDATRSAADSTVHLSLANPLSKGQTATYTFVYNGVLDTGDNSPVPGLKLAYVGDPISYLLYAGRWFPMVGYLTSRFTMEAHIRVPAGETAIASGFLNEQKLPDGRTQFNFNWTKPGFPGTIIAGKFLPSTTPSGATNIHVYVTETQKDDAMAYADTAMKEQDYFTNLFGQPESGHLNVIEIPNDTVPAYWAPEMAILAGSRFSNPPNYRLLANTIAHQWWGCEVSPATLNDAWIINGMARYGELMYLENVAGKTAFQSAVSDIAAGALAYDTIPLSSAGRLAPFSPDFQSMTLEKGAMVFHMLRWEMGDDAFQKTLRGILSQYAGKPVTTDDVQKVAEAQSQLQLTSFFAQWLNGTGAPDFTNKYTVFRLGSNKGFRTVGQISQDLDLFRMPIELRIETNGKTVDKRIDVVGSDSQYVVDTFGEPRSITIDPNNWVLKSSPAMTVRVSILRGQSLVAEGDYIGALDQYKKALKVNPNSSLASYRIAEVFFLQKNYQAAANSFRDALRGDNDPRWTEVWSHISLGKIFDVTGQRDRAVNEYRLAVQTNDNTQGAINQAREYLQKPYKPATS
ncbi:MAG: M1 family aminopeptidase [Acidobacteriaceae bacterium]